ncbi:hypothetical protein DL95DRAFT_487676 [Leptodontidium sp. 2 PMI_412]|nr:hypothetical protein DL95DRAFT_487676 [Leptodontidium sp. 2 PMI_412]
MPPNNKRQKLLPFARAVVTYSTSEAIVLDSENALAEPAVSPLESNLSPSLAPSSQGTPQPESLSRAKPATRVSWVYRHMPDEDIQTMYFNQYTGKPEWRCRYCEKAYALSGSTSGPGTHLEVVHKLSRDSPRTAKAQNIKNSLETAFAQAAANP